jgi:hypothetical protein
VTLGPPQKLDLDAVSRRLEMMAPGVVGLRAVGSLEGVDDRLDGIVEEEPWGTPLAEAHPSQSQAIALGIELCDLLDEASIMGCVLVGLRPELIYVDEAFELTRMAPRCEPFLATATPACQGVTHFYDKLYQAPEVLALREPTAATDIFSAATIVTEMLTGVHPFPGVGWPHLESILAGERHPWTGPPALAEILDACLDTEAGARPSADELGTALRTFAESV